MTDHQGPELDTDPEQDEAIFIFRMVGIGILQGALVVEGGTRFIEADAVLSDVRPILALIPIKAQLIDLYIICTDGPTSNTRVRCCGN